MITPRPVYCNKKVAVALAVGAAAAGAIYYYYFANKSNPDDKPASPPLTRDNIGTTKAPPREVPPVVPVEANVTLAPGLSHPVRAVPVAPQNKEGVAKTFDPNYQTLAGINNDLFNNK